VLSDEKVKMQRDERCFPGAFYLLDP